MKFTSEVSLKIRTAIKVKLAELGNDVYEELPDYIMVMVANKKTEEQMTEDLSLFLGDNTEQFTSWLHRLLCKLQSVASVSAVKQRTSISTASGFAKSPELESDQENSAEVASSATPGSDEASTSRLPNYDDGDDDEPDDSNGNSSFSDADNMKTLTIKSVDNVDCDSVTVGKDSENNDNEKHTSVHGKGSQKRKAAVPETRVIKIKVQRVDRNGSRKKKLFVQSQDTQNDIEKEQSRENQWNNGQEAGSPEKENQSQPSGGEMSSFVQSNLKEKEDSAADNNLNNDNQDQDLSENLENEDTVNAASETVQLKQI